MTKKHKPKTFNIERKRGESNEQALARTALNPLLQSAASVRDYVNIIGCLDLNSLVEALETQVKQIKDGNLERPEAILLAQAHTLDALFHHLLRRSAINMGEYFGAAEKYMKLALKAQSQCRTTVDNLASMKNPKTHLSQTNIGLQH